jgi:hypothetical protein
MNDEHAVRFQVFRTAGCRTQRQFLELMALYGLLLSRKGACVAVNLFAHNGLVGGSSPSTPTNFTIDIRGLGARVRGGFGFSEPNAVLCAAAELALRRQEELRRLPTREQLRRMAAFLMYGGIGDD